MTSQEFTKTLASAKVLAQKIRPTDTVNLVNVVEQYLSNNGINVGTVGTAMFILGAGIRLKPMEMLNLINIVDMEYVPE